MIKKFIVFEGPDGSGKSTILNNVKEKLEKQGYKIVSHREPGGTKISEKIRDIILDNDNKEMNSRCEALLYAASRAQLIAEKIKPELEKGSLILCDRFVLSSLMYQGIGRNLGVDTIKSINDFAIGEIKPGLTLFFDIDYKIALERKKKNCKTDRLENEDELFHKKTYDGYVQLAKKYENEIVKINANLDIESVTDLCLKEIKKYLEVEK